MPGRRGRQPRRAAEPEDIGRVAAFLASDEAGYVNGADIVVDGAHTVVDGGVSVMAG